MTGIFPWGKSGRRVGRQSYHFHMPTLYNFWEPQHPGAHGACPGLKWESFTFVHVSRIPYRQDLEGKINVKVIPSHRNKNPNILSVKVNICLIYIATVECVILRRILTFRHFQKLCTQDNRNNAIVHIVLILGCSRHFIYCTQIRVSSIHFFALTSTSKAQLL